MNNLSEEYMNNLPEEFNLEYKIMRRLYEKRTLITAWTILALFGYAPMPCVIYYLYIISMIMLTLLHANFLYGLLLIPFIIICGQIVICRINKKIFQKRTKILNDLALGKYNIPEDAYIFIFNDTALESAPCYNFTFCLFCLPLSNFISKYIFSCACFRCTYLTSEPV